MKNGLINSTGCNLKKKMLSHLLEPLTSTPIKGTKINKINRNRKSGAIALFSISKRTDEIANIRDNDKNAKIKCLMKKK